MGYLPPKHGKNTSLVQMKFYQGMPSKNQQSYLLGQARGNEHIKHLCKNETGF